LVPMTGGGLALLAQRRLESILCENTGSRVPVESTSGSQGCFPSVHQDRRPREKLWRSFSRRGEEWAACSRNIALNRRRDPGRHFTPWTKCSDATSFTGQGEISEAGHATERDGIGVHIASKHSSETRAATLSTLVNRPPFLGWPLQPQSATIPVPHNDDSDIHFLRLSMGIQIFLHFDPSVCTAWDSSWPARAPEDLPWLTRDVVWCRGCARDACVERVQAVPGQRASGAASQRRARHQAVDDTRRDTAAWVEGCGYLGAKGIYGRKDMRTPPKEIHLSIEHPLRSS